MSEPPSDQPRLPEPASERRPELRVSDAERNRVVDVLRRHCADGLLTLDEFSDRVGAVFAARTQADLVAVTADLPVDQSPIPESGRRRVTRNVVAVMTANHRRGRWRAGDEVNAVSIMGGVQLDLRQAEIDGSELIINAVAIMGGVHIIVPEGIEVELTGLPIMGGKHLQLADVPRLPGSPIIRVRGFTIMGGIHVQSRRTKPARPITDRKRERDERKGKAAPLPGGPLPMLERQQERVDRRREKFERRVERHREVADMVAYAAQEARAAIEQARREWERAAREWDRDSWTPEDYVPDPRGRAPAASPAPPAAPAASPPDAPPAPPPAPPPRAEEARPSSPAEAPPPSPAETPPPSPADATGAETTVAPPAAPDGTVTILFSDICGSTALNERLGDLRTHDVIRAHNGIVRDHLGDHEGYEVKTAGDGVMAAFAGASKALRCATDIQRSVDKWCAEHPDEEFSIHLGLHTGETIKEGNDFFGRTVILASRITAQAGPGEVLVSSLLKELTEWTGEFQYGDLREVTLKGVSTAQKVYPLLWQDAGAA